MAERIGQFGWIRWRTDHVEQFQAFLELLKDSYERGQLSDFETGLMESIFGDNQPVSRSDDSQGGWQLLFTVELDQPLAGSSNRADSITCADGNPTFRSSAADPDAEIDLTELDGPQRAQALAGIPAELLAICTGLSAVWAHTAVWYTFIDDTTIELVIKGYQDVDCLVDAAGFEARLATRITELLAAT